LHMRKDPAPQRRVFHRYTRRRASASLIRFRLVANASADHDFMVATPHAANDRAAPRPKSLSAEAAVAVTPAPIVIAIAIAEAGASADIDAHALRFRRGRRERCAAEQARRDDRQCSQFENAHASPPCAYPFAANVHMEATFRKTVRFHLKWPFISQLLFTFRAKKGPARRGLSKSRNNNEGAATSADRRFY
jgi:hypothetical protein